MHNPHSWYKKRLCHVIAHISLRPACYRCVKKIASKRFHFESYHNRRVRPKLASNSAQHASRSEDTGIRSASEHVRTDLRSLPNDFISKVIITEEFVQNLLQIVPSMPVAVKIQGSGRLQNTFALNQSFTHVRNIHINPFIPTFPSRFYMLIFPKKVWIYRVPQFLPILVRKSHFRVMIPLTLNPKVLIMLLREERRVKIYEVNGLIWNLL